MRPVRASEARVSSNTFVFRLIYNLLILRHPSLHYLWRHLFINGRAKCNAGLSLIKLLMYLYEHLFHGIN